MILCNDCKHLSHTEEDQLVNKYVEHRCNEYYIKVFHKGGVPKGKPVNHNIYPCKICSGSKFIKRESV